MTNLTNIIDKLININVNVKNNGFNTFSNYTLLLHDKNIKILQDEEWKDIGAYKSYEETSKVSEIDRMIIADNTVKITGLFNLANIKVDESDEDTKTLKKIISTYFLEGGKNLHLFTISDSNTISKNFNYTTAICYTTSNDNVNKFISLHSNIELFYLGTKKLSEEKIMTQNVFYLETNEVHWLAHTAAYLNNINLKNNVNDYNFTKSRTIIPEIDSLFTIDKNYIVNINGQGVVIGNKMVDGQNLTNKYILKQFEKRLKYVLFNEMLNKPKRHEIVGKLNNLLTTELNNLYTINAINGDIYRDVDLTTEYNGETFKILSTGELLPKGFKVHIVDILKSTNEDYTNEKMTPITIVLMLQKQIKFLSLNLEVN